MKKPSNKNIILIVALVVIVGAIGYLQYQKAANTVSVAPGSDDIPLMTGTTTPLGEGICTTSVCTSSATSVSPTVTNDITADTTSGYLTIAQKEKMYPRAKELVSPDGFINTDPFKIADLIGKKVILIDFWTYSCINCQRTIPYLNSWYTKYEDKGLVIIGVHTPEFGFEKVLANVQAAVSQYGIKYPVVLDNEMGTWNAYQSLYWPNEYLIDIDGFIVHQHAGEGDYQATEQSIQDALNERAARLGTPKVTDALTPDTSNVDLAVSPETYFGSNRNEYLANGPLGQSGVQSFAYDFSAVSTGRASQLYLGGSWNINPEYAESQGSTTIAYRYVAKNMYFVADSTGPITVQIYSDGVYVKDLTINGPQLYTLISNGDGQEHTLEIRVPKAGLKAYTFTFG